jgi:hypothetical protein
MHSWIRKLFTRPAVRTIRKQPRRVRLAVETLEDRITPSNIAFSLASPTVSTTASNAPGTLVNLGTLTDTNVSGGTLNNSPIRSPLTGATRGEAPEPR